ncbi:MAG: hypothetical protein D6820_11135, partial [Lentisphaerae bacterium]
MMQNRVPEWRKDISCTQNMGWGLAWLMIALTLFPGRSAEPCYRWGVNDPARSGAIRSLEGLITAKGWQKGRTRAAHFVYDPVAGQSIPWPGSFTPTATAIPLELEVQPQSTASGFTLEAWVLVKQPPATDLPLIRLHLQKEDKRETIWLGLTYLPRWKQHYYGGAIGSTAVRLGHYVSHGRWRKDRVMWRHLAVTWVPATRRMTFRMDGYLQASVPAELDGFNLTGIGLNPVPQAQYEIGMVKLSLRHLANYELLRARNEKITGVSFRDDRPSPLPEDIGCY